MRLRKKIVLGITVMIIVVIGIVCISFEQCHCPFAKKTGDGALEDYRGAEEKMDSNRGKISPLLDQQKGGQTLITKEQSGSMKRKNSDRITHKKSELIIHTSENTRDTKGKKVASERVKRRDKTGETIIGEKTIDTIHDNGEQMLEKPDTDLPRLR